MTDASIAVVVLDTLRQDVFERYFEWLPGVRFENTYSTSHWTIPAHASLLTGRYPSEVGIHGKSRTFDCPESSIVERLHEDGYTTRMWSENTQLNTVDGWTRGFDEFLRSESLDPRFADSVDWQAYLNETDESGPWRYVDRVRHAVVSPEPTIPSLVNGLRLFRSGMKVGDTTPAIRDRLAETEFGDREFLFMNLMTAHTPHRPPQPFRTTDDEVNFQIGDAFAGTAGDHDTNRRAYDDSAAYLAWIYRDIFSELVDEFDYVVTLSDHGELLGEHDLWNHGYGLYPELVRVPLVISGSDLESSSRQDVTSLLDVPQTLATLAGVEFESRGRDLFSATAPRTRLVEYQGFLPWHREQFERKGVGEVYDELDGSLRGMVTASNRYCYQTHRDGLRSTTDSLRLDDRSRLESMVDEIPERTTRPEHGDDVSDEIKDRLRELGYA